jgi:hypothetical protein
MADPTNPDYYKFPNGAETIDITEWLSSCGGQAVQYITRATRTDGKVKGDPIEDLSKAIWFLSRERGRLRALKGDGHQVEAWADVPPRAADES